MARLAIFWSMTELREVKGRFTQMGTLALVALSPACRACMRHLAVLMTNWWRLSTCCWAWTETAYPSTAVVTLYMGSSLK